MSNEKWCFKMLFVWNWWKSIAITIERASHIFFLAISTQNYVFFLDETGSYHYSGLLFVLYIPCKSAASTTILTLLTLLWIEEWLLTILNDSAVNKGYIVQKEGYKRHFLLYQEAEANHKSWWLPFHFYSGKCQVYFTFLVVFSNCLEI